MRETQDNNEADETYALWKLSHQSKHNQLLLHPVIDVFLNLKWAKLSSKYYSDCRLSFMNVVLLTWAIFIMSAGDFRENGMICVWKKTYSSNGETNITIKNVNMVCSTGYWIFASTYSGIILSIVIEKMILLINNHYHFGWTLTFYMWKDCLIIVIGAIILASRKIEGIAEILARLLFV